MKSKRVPKIFINYRRDDASESASRLNETLTHHFGARHVFWDGRTIPGGAIFDKSIEDAINSTTVLLAVIGKDWLTISRDGKRRLDDEDDYVCREIAGALEQGACVIPVLVEGAPLPREIDLPLKIRKLVKSQKISVSPATWREDVKRLIESIEKNFQRDAPYSSIFGAAAGFLAGTIFGIFYKLGQPAVPSWRIVPGGFSGLVAAWIISKSINYGIAECSRLLRWSPWANPIGGTLGGAVGGLIASFLIAAGSIWVKVGEPVNPLGVAAAVAASSIFIAGGILFPEWRKEWFKRLATLLAVVIGTFIPVVLAVWLLHEKLPHLQDQFRVNSPLTQGVVIIGLVCGGMSGLQVGLTLWFYDHLPSAEDLRL